MSVDVPSPVVWIVHDGTEYRGELHSRGALFDVRVFQNGVLRINQTFRSRAQAEAFLDEQKRIAYGRT